MLRNLQANELRGASRPKRAAVVGALLTPVGAGLSLQVAPFVGPALLYALAGLLFGYRAPHSGWRLGGWLVLGLVVATGAVGATILLFRFITSGTIAETWVGLVEFARITLLFVGLPGLAGGCVGGWAGAALARRARRRVWLRGAP